MFRKSRLTELIECLATRSRINTFAIFIISFTTLLYFLYILPFLCERLKCYIATGLVYFFI